jgi:folate-dependent phosphoribosylglycinamide formyltransferase PurN/ribosomal protein S18 acetylase RimI-like enzyme
MSHSWKIARRCFALFTTNLSALLNLVVDLAIVPSHAPSPAGIEVAPPATADERTLAWIDETFDGVWSSEAYRGRNVIARRDGVPVGFATIDSKGFKYAWLGGVAREPGVAIIGPLGVSPQERGKGIGRLLLQRGLGALRDGGFARAILPAVGSDGLARYYATVVGARVAERLERSALFRPGRRALVMASGSGSNFQAVLDAVRSGVLPLEIVALLSNNERAYVIERARAAGIPARVLTWNRAEESRAQYDERVLNAATAESPDLVLLLGWMHLLAPTFVQAFPEMLNLHPAFLPLDPQRDDVVLPDGTQMPAFRGARAVRDALAASSDWVGATLHRVTPATDRGPVMARMPVRVMPGEAEAPLMERLHQVEHRLVVAGITRWLYEGER